MDDRGDAVRAIQSHLQEIYGLGLSPELISATTDVGTVEMTESQLRAFEAMYPIVCVDALLSGHGLRHLG